jgi:hypothetical protein
MVFTFLIVNGVAGGKLIEGGHLLPNFSEAVLLAFERLSAQPA